MEFTQVYLLFYLFGCLSLIFNDKESKLGSYEEENTVPKCIKCGFEYARMTDLRTVYLLEHLCTVYHCPNCNKEVCRDYHFRVGDRIDEGDKS